MSTVTPRRATSATVRHAARPAHAVPVDSRHELPDSLPITAADIRAFRQHGWTIVEQRSAGLALSSSCGGLSNRPCTSWLAHCSTTLAPTTRVTGSPDHLDIRNDGGTVMTIADGRPAAAPANTEARVDERGVPPVLHPLLAERWAVPRGVVGFEVEFLGAYLPFSIAASSLSRSG